MRRSRDSTRRISSSRTDSGRDTSTAAFAARHALRDAATATVLVAVTARAVAAFGEPELFGVRRKNDGRFLLLRYRLFHFGVNLFHPRFVFGRERVIDIVGLDRFFRGGGDEVVAFSSPRSKRGSAGIQSMHHRHSIFLSFF